MAAVAAVLAVATGLGARVAAGATVRAGGAAALFVGELACGVVVLPHAASMATAANVHILRRIRRSI